MSRTERTHTQTRTHANTMTSRACETGGLETPSMCDVAPDLRGEGENMCAGKDDKKKQNCPNHQALSLTIARYLSDSVRMWESPRAPHVFRSREPIFQTLIWEVN